MIASAGSKPAPTRAGPLFAVLMTLLTAGGLSAGTARAQDWGDDSADDWSQPRQPTESASSARPQSSTGSSGGSGLSARVGLGFTADPDTFLLNFEVPYALNEWVAAGPMVQVGLSGKNTIVAPTGNVTLRAPDLPGQSLDRIHPYGFAGLGFAYIEKEDRGNGNGNSGDGAGFLINCGAGIEYQVSEKVFLGSQMIFNFIPKETQDENFIYAWQIGGIRFAF